MLVKYDTFFIVFATINFFISFLCVITFNIPVEVHNYYDFTMAENLNNVYMSGKKWTIQNGLYMLFTGLGCIGIIWVTETDKKVDWLYCGLRYRLKRWYNS